MMKRQHPIDDLFRRGLKNQSVPPPMHVWERVDENRAIRQRGELVLVRRKAALISSAAAVLLLGVWLGWQSTPELGSFPIVTPPSIAAVETATVMEEEKNDRSINNSPNSLAGRGPVSSNVESPIAFVSAGPRPSGVSTTFEVSESKEVLENTSGVSSVAVEEKLPSKKLTTFSDLSPLSTATAAIPTEVQALEMELLPNPETGCARFSEGRPALFFALTTGPTFPSRTFTARDEEYLGYANQRTETETAQLSYGASARLSLVFPWGGAIRTGVAYSQINERMVFKNSRVRQTTITEIYGPNGEVIGTDTTYITDNTVLKFNNRHRMIDIPVQLGYEVRYNKLTLAANAGVNINIAYAQQGSYLGDQDLLPTRFDSDDPNLRPIYKSKVGLGWQASLGLHYQLNDHLDLMAEPYLRYYPESFTRNDYPLSQKYLIGGVGLGLRVLL